MTAKPGRGYRVRSHGCSACRVYKRCIHLIGIHAASKFLASTCYPGLSLFLPIPSSLCPLASLCLSVPVSIFPCLTADLFPPQSPFFIVARSACSLGLLLCTCVCAYVRAYIKFLNEAPFLIKETARSQFR